MQCLVIGCEVPVEHENLATMAGCDGHLCGIHGNGTGVVRTLEQEAIEIGFALATSEAENDVVLSPNPVLDREVYHQMRPSYDPQSLFLLLL